MNDQSDKQQAQNGASEDEHVDAVQDETAEQGQAAAGDGPSEPGAEPGRTEAGGEAGDALARAEGEVARLTEALARNQAERLNHEKRLEREMDKARKFALERLMRDFVQVLDSLDQAIAASGDTDGDAALEGLALTRKLALKVLEEHGLETIDPEGQPFDANWHEAMTAAPNPDVAPDTVLQVLQTGYALNGRLLRPARVVVAKTP